MSKFLIVLILGLSLTFPIWECPSSSADDLLGLKVIYEGKVPVAISAINSGKLLGGNHDQLIVQKDQELYVYSLDESGYKKAGMVVLPDSATVGREYGCWTAGDIDNDGQDEIVVFYAHRILLYKWDGEMFTESRYEVSGVVDQLRIGDINNDGFNEIVSFRYHEDPHATVYWLYVGTLEEKGLRELWSDGGSLGYVKTDIIPTDYLGCVADYENMGCNEVLVMEGQSDVRASQYHLLVWDQDGLTVAKSCRIVGTLDGTEESMPLEPQHGRKERQAWVEKHKKLWEAIHRPGKKLIPTLMTRPRMYGFPIAIGELKPFLFRGEIVLFCSLFMQDESRRLRHELALLKIKNGVVETIPTVWKPKDIVLRLDPDGKGEGILYIFFSKEKGPLYRFYR